MCAAVATTPEVVTVPKACGHLLLEAPVHWVLTIMMSVVPEALPPTGGTSWAPVSLAGALPAPAHPAARIAAMPMPAQVQRDRFAICRMVFIDYLPNSVTRPA